VMFDANGDRPGFTATIYNFHPVSSTPADLNEGVWAAGQWNMDPVTMDVSETQYDTRSLAGGITIPGFFAYPPIDFYNERV